MIKVNEIQTIDINTLSWWDKPNGNTYIAGEVVVNYNERNEVMLSLPFQYGCAAHYAAKVKMNQSLGLEIRDMWTFCRDHEITLRKNGFQSTQAGLKSLVRESILRGAI